MSFSVDQRPRSGGKIVRQKDKSKESTLKMLPPESSLNGREDTWERSNGSNRPSSGRKSSSTKRAPPVQKSDSYTPRRTPTPSKQVSLQVTRRKESSEDASFGEFDWQEHERLESARLNTAASSRPKNSYPSTHAGRNTERNHSYKANGNTKEARRSRHRCDRSESDSTEEDNVGDKTAELMLKQCYKKDDVSDLMQDMGFAQSDSSSKQGASARCRGTASRDTGETQGSDRVKEEKGQGVIDIEDSDQFDTDLENEEESNDEEAETEKPKAPDELKMEFLGAVMRQEWPEAQRLCQMILIYEPEHEEANSFKELIAEKVQLEAELAEESDGSDYETDDEDEGDSSDESSDDESEDESSEEEENQASGSQSQNLDSGISSTTDLQKY